MGDIITIWCENPKLKSLTETHAAYKSVAPPPQKMIVKI